MSGAKDFINDAELVLVGFADPAVEREVRAQLEHPMPVRSVATLSAAEQTLQETAVAVLALGPGVCGPKPEECLSFLETFKQRHPFQWSTHLVLGLADKAVVRRLVQEDLLFFSGPGDAEPASTAELVCAATEHYRRTQVLGMAAETGVEDRRAVIARTVLAAAETLLQTTELEAAGMPVFEALRDLIGVQDARLWLYDPTQHVLRDTASAEIEMSAVTGVTSYAARTARPVLAEAFETDRRYDAEVDGSGGHLLAVPVAGPEDQVLGVLAMRRESPAFGPEDLEIGQRLASHLAPILSLYAPQVLEHALQTGTQGSDAELFRREALEAQARGFSERGRILQNTRGWTEWTWRLLLSGFLAALLFTVIGRMHDYAAGPAVVRIGQRIDVTAPVGAPVTSVEVRALQEVRAGDPLVRLFGAPQASQIANLEAEFEQRLRRRLAQPADTLIEASLIDVRTRLEEAKARLDERTVRSPIDGVVGDVRVRPGQHPVIGEVLMSVVADSEKRTVIGLMPGHFKPQLESEQRLRLTLQGYPDLALELRVEQVGEEVIAADEALQVLGRTIAPAVQSSGPVVVVEAGLSEASFSDGRNTLAFSDGMQGTAEIRVRSRPLLFHLIPGLDRALRGLEGAGDE